MLSTLSVCVANIPSFNTMAIVMCVFFFIFILSFGIFFSAICSLLHTITVIIAYVCHLAALLFGPLSPNTVVAIARAACDRSFVFSIGIYTNRKAKRHLNYNFK